MVARGINSLDGILVLDGGSDYRYDKPPRMGCNIDGVDVDPSPTLLGTGPFVLTNYMSASYAGLIVRVATEIRCLSPRSTLLSEKTRHSIYVAQQEHGSPSILRQWDCSFSTSWALPTLADGTSF